MVVRRGQRRKLRGPAELTLEDDAILRCENTLSGDLPNGYHRLRYLSDDCDSNLIVSPGVCYLPDP
jgi:hypothetical protein